MKFFAVIADVALTICGWNYVDRPLTCPAGVLVPAEPQQTATTAVATERADYQLRALAHLAIARR